MQKITKIGVTHEADQALDRMLIAVKEGYSGGKITKNDLASWIMVRFELRSFQSQIKNIREDHFDNVQYLISVVQELKRAKRGEKEISLSDILAPLASQINSSSAPVKRRSRKSEMESSPDQTEPSSS